ncbi:hypothetical protein J5S49_14740 [Virgibacillus halodenitrificans]|uniref:Uncharacterized protein n=1 Tax=Virgibacillus halodenitrificans TaxID=1482 RepID=A0AAC9NKB3_VIRHA|nr:hypothetical protein [Virgibacillus halodenitrificans]APC46852.1 hypothetical protein BME96_00930 [Virgibacillus halodenitrificans]APC47665.1 hypothetical protein BME96_05565 [Virgibacillus halodenitrificans]MCG1029550.1 hypothetical protein [Virgibacillus halodenitrificans]CDQ36072.1 hypothetical protein BN993_05567 [Virgibacillus halodenitrificans]
MEYSNVNNSNKKMGLVVGELIIGLFMIFDIYLFMTKVELAPRLLAGGSFVLLLGLFIFGLKKINNIEK